MESWIPQYYIPLPKFALEDLKKNQLNRFCRICLYRAGGTSPFKYKCPERLLTAKSWFTQLRRAGLFHSLHERLDFLTWGLRLGSPALLAFCTPRLTTLLERSRNSVIFRCLPSSASVATTALGTQSPRNPLWLRSPFWKENLSRSRVLGYKFLLNGQEKKRCPLQSRDGGSLKLRLANLRWPSLLLEMSGAWEKGSPRFNTRGHFSLW